MGILFISFLATTILVFLLVFLLFRKFSQRKNISKDPRYWLVSVVASPVVYIGFLLIWLLMSSSFEAKEFTKENWANNRNTRYEYVSDLIDNNKLIGLTKIELDSTLGKADYEDDSITQYYIGYSPKVLLNNDPDWLITDLVEGKVSNAYIRE